MKKLLFAGVLIFLCISGIQAQNDTVMSVSELQQTSGPLSVCTNKYNRVVVYAEGCDNVTWIVNGATYSDNPMIFDSQVSYVFGGSYLGCGNGFQYGIIFKDPNVPAETTTELWKRQHEAITLEAPEGSYDYLWSTGEITAIIEVTEPSTYTCDVSDMCATSVQTFVVRDNVELYRATCDLHSNLNQVTWQTTPEQAEYVGQVKVYRNTNQLVATLPYTDGIFTDSIGSEATQWQYHLVAVDTDGNDCPIPSYWKRTIHLDHVQGTQGNEILQWTPYQDEQESNSVIAYNIYDVVNGEPRMVVQVGNFTNVYAYNPSDFNGYGAVAAVFASKDMNDLAFSNHTANILGVGENVDVAFTIYPNPAQGKLTVEGTGTLTVTNALGQSILTQEIDGKMTMELPKGLYFAKMGNTVRKIVVE